MAVLAKLMGRTERSIAMRLGNFMHVDPKSPNEGLFGGRGPCEPLFREFEGQPLRLAEEAADARQRLSEIVRHPHESRLSAPQKLAEAGKALENGIVEYSNTRLHFNANRIEPLGWDEIFRVRTPFGVYQMTKRQFYEAFPNVVKTNSYLVGRHYHSATLHLQAERFRVE